MTYTKSDALKEALEFSRQNPLRLGDVANLLADADQVYTWLNAPDAPAVVEAPILTDADAQAQTLVDQATAAQPDATVAVDATPPAAQ